MEDVLTLVSRLHRPNILVQTARHGLDDFRRGFHLARLLHTEAIPRPALAILKLMEIEAIANEQRLEERADYSIARHIEILVAIMSEAATLRAMQRSRARAALAPSVIGAPVQETCPT